MRGSLIASLCSRSIGYLFPTLCIVCDRPRSAGQEWLCDECLNGLRENNVRRDACPRCAMNRSLATSCACAHGWDHPFEGIYAILDYDDLAQALLHQVKYHGRKRLGRDLGAMLSAFVPSSFFDGFDALLAVPLHPSRLRKRGYNQAQQAALGIGLRQPNLPVLDGVLRRIRNTTSQTKLDKTLRERNMTGAFTVDPKSIERVAGKRLILIDDVITTGATTASAANALRKAGCAAVGVLSIARD